MPLHGRPLAGWRRGTGRSGRRGRRRPHRRRSRLYPGVGLLGRALPEGRGRGALRAGCSLAWATGGSVGTAVSRVGGSGLWEPPPLWQTRLPGAARWASLSAFSRSLIWCCSKAALLLAKSPGRSLKYVQCSLTSLKTAKRSSSTRARRGVSSHTCDGARRGLSEPSGPARAKSSKLS